MQSVHNKVVNRIYGKGMGWCFTPKDFLDLGQPEAIRIALFRLARKGTIRRLARGLYDYPKKHNKIGLAAPSPNSVAQALMSRDATRLQPSGAYASNLLGLSEQVPAKVTFLTDGPARRIKLGRQEIILQHTTPRNMATAGKKSGMILQALRYLSKRHINNRHIAHLREKLTGTEKKQLKKDSVYAPNWLQPYINAIVEDSHD